MRPQPERNIVCFGPFELDLRAGELHREGNTLRLQEQPFQLLKMLLERPGEVVSREAIRRTLWPNDTIVAFDQSINAAIKKLRVALVDSAENPVYIETVARRGYRFIVAVTRANNDELPVAERRATPAHSPEHLRSTNLIGRKVSHYRVLQILGGGGMGVVYAAEDLRLGRRVALKFLPDDVSNDPGVMERFRREARAASALNHPNICTVHEVDEHLGQPFIAMELLEGQTLREAIQMGTSTPGSDSQHAVIPLERFLSIAVQTAEGLNAAHRKGIIHRDIKPANLFLTTTGQVKILDFGLAKVQDVEPPDAQAPSDLHVTNTYDPSLTRTGAAMGTAGYMSPEQVRGEKVDARTDLFSLGAVLYEMATGQRAFDGETAPSIHEAILNGTPAPVRKLNPQIPTRLQDVIHRAIEKNRELRYQSAAELALDLDSLKQTGTKTARWRSPAVLMGGLVSTVGLVALMVAARGRDTSSQPIQVPTLQQIRMRKLTDNDQATGAAISPDGRYVVFARAEERGESLWVRQIATRTDVRVIPSDGTAFHGLTFSPDGSLVYLVRSHPNDPFGKSLYSIPMLGGIPRLVIPDIDGPITFSPDGKQFAFEDCTTPAIRLRIARVDRDDVRQLASIGANCGIFQPGPRWSPDGRTIAVPVLKPNNERWSLATVSVDDGTVRELLSSFEPFGRPTWLAGGHVLLVPHAEGDFTELQLWTVTFPGGEARRLTDDLSFYDLGLDSTPDGHAAVTIASTRISDVWVTSADDPEHAQQISGGLSVAKASELANGRILAVDREGKLWTMDRDGGQRTSFSSLKDVNSFMRCGSEIVASVDTEGRTITYFRVDMDGSHAVRLVGGDNFAVATACSAMGHDLFYSTQKRIFRIPIAGGTPTEVGHDLSVGVPFPLGVSPDETKVTYLTYQSAPGSEGWRVAVVRTSDGSAVASWPVTLPPNHPRKFRWSPHGLLWQFLKADSGAYNVWEQPIAGGESTQLTRFTSGRIFDFDWSLDAKRLVMSRGSLGHDVVLLTVN